MTDTPTPPLPSWRWRDRSSNNQAISVPNYLLTRSLEQKFLKPIVVKPMTVIKEVLPVGSTNKLKEAFERRQQDTGWGRAWAHIIPFYVFYYAATRRTVTPLGFAMLGNLLTGALIGLCVVSVNPQITENELDAFGTLGIFVMPVWVKKGIDNSRTHAAKRLEEMS